MDCPGYTNTPVAACPAATNYGNVPVNGAHLAGIPPAGVAGPPLNGSNNVAVPINGVTGCVDARYDTAFEPTVMETEFRCGSSPGVKAPRIAFTLLGSLVAIAMMKHSDVLHSADCLLIGGKNPRLPDGFWSSSPWFSIVWMHPTAQNDRSYNEDINPRRPSMAACFFLKNSRYWGSLQWRTG